MTGTAYYFLNATLASLNEKACGFIEKPYGHKVIKTVRTVNKRHKMGVYFETNQFSYRFRFKMADFQKCIHGSKS